VPVLAKNKCRTGRLWGHVRDDRPFGGKAAPAVVLYYSPNREGAHPQRQLANYTGIMQADAYSGFDALYVAGRQPGPIVEAACWAHGRRKLFDLARLRKMPIAIEAVRRIDELFAIEREINGQAPDKRLHVRCERSKPLVAIAYKEVQAAHATHFNALEGAEILHRGGFDHPTRGTC
jgi:transposase